MLLVKSRVFLFFWVEVTNFNVPILSHFSWLSYNNLQDHFFLVKSHFSWFSITGFPMVSQHFLLKSQFSMVSCRFPLCSHGIPIVFHCFPIVFHCFPMVFPWFSHGFPWFSMVFHCFSIVSLWFSIVFPWFPHSFPIGFPWFSHCFSHCFPMVFHGFPMVLHPPGAGATSGRTRPCWADAGTESSMFPFFGMIFQCFWWNFPFSGIILQLCVFFPWCPIDFPIQISNSLAVSMHFSIVRFTMDTPLYFLNSVTICFVFFHMFVFFCCFCLTDMKGIWLV